MSTLHQHYITWRAAELLPNVLSLMSITYITLTLHYHYEQLRSCLSSITLRLHHSSLVNTEIERKRIFSKIDRLRSNHGNIYYLHCVFSKSMLIRGLQQVTWRKYLLIYIYKYKLEQRNSCGITLHDVEHYITRTLAEVAMEFPLLH